MMKYLVSSLFVVFFVSFSQASSGERSKVAVDPVFTDGGNRWQYIQVRASTSPVLISSAPENAGLGINDWRYREIVNTSEAGLSLYPNSSYTVYSSSFGVHLSSDSNTLGAGDSWVVPHQNEVWGVWSSSSGRGGAGGYETYFRR